MNWQTFKSLHQLYTDGLIKLKPVFVETPEIKFLISTANFLQVSYRYITIQPGFKELYEQKYLPSFLRYKHFMEETGLEKPQAKFQVEDMEVLMKLKSLMDDGGLKEIREQIIQNEESVRGVSLMFFKHEKYLLDKQSLTEALKQILQVESFANEKDQQYLYALHCHNPRMIVLCENIEFLTRPVKPRKHAVELWFAGGRNIQKLAFADSRGLPLYYCCDWDLDGLQIYQDIKNLLPSISLLTPNGIPKSIKDTEHKSLWHTEQLFSGLRQELYSPEQIILIQQLIDADQWIIEESNNLIEMLPHEDQGH